ncbi:cysteine--tRNA ligase [Celeribacter marinus]|uniref:Cysteine--tRNA ligase n=1 Tax=Celeribacter marinus TaxID=1397108 RepID=A0A0N7HI59_9RHOB|nr:cysteine--tRNA ligase [Celeribacter marinus]ALI54309.1 cysteinyl-tRNA synthetase [Celeribacter marinus]SFK35039.1 cysteinyl-tRNA synthetase [Celeribacter marinus]
MTEIKLTNTKTRKKDVFVPIDDTNVRMYVCGPTVYDRAHIGNARPVIVFDVLYRLLREIYGADHVTYVRNFTDVDDKINARAAASGRTINEITDETIQWYLDDMRAVGALDPDQMPRATRYIPQMIAMIEELIAKGHAYSDGAGHVLFSVDSYAKYGALSGRSTDDMIAGARVEVADYKRDPMDFVLWKPSVGDQPGWDSPWGVGRPGWHIECSAMAKDLLGDHFDIHGGGNDLMFPHHENEIAQSCCASGHADDGDGFANVWLHNEMLQVEGKKMSKSLGNFFTVRDLLDQGVAGEVIRFVFLSTHYRKPMDWTAEKAAQAEATLKSWRKLLDGAEPTGADQAVVELVADDLNTAGAITLLHKMAKDIAANPQKDCFYEKGAMLASAQLLGLLTTPSEADDAGFDLSAYADRLATLRATAMETKDFGPVDALKTALLDAGVEVRMSKTGVELDAGPTFDASKLEGLL